MSGVASTFLPLNILIFDENSCPKAICDRTEFTMYYIFEYIIYDLKAIFKYIQSVNLNLSNDSCRLKKQLSSMKHSICICLCKGKNIHHIPIQFKILHFI